MKEKVFDIAFRYLILNIAFLPVIFVMRILEYYYLAYAVDLQLHPFATEAAGLLYDLRAFFVFAFVLFIPFLLISLLHRKIATILYIVFLCLLTLLQFSLIRYFAVNLVPLDEILYLSLIHI